jgi:DNA modification methylase
MPIRTSWLTSMKSGPSAQNGLRSRDKMSISLLKGDCLDLLPTIASESVDAVVTDPPYGLEFMSKEWDGADGFRRSLNKADIGRDNAFGRLSSRGPEYRTAGTGQKNKPGIGARNTEWVNNQGWNQFRCGTCGHLFHGGSPCECAEPKPVRADNRWNLFQTWCEAWARECLRVLKPGAHLVAFGGTRTYHRLACAIEDAGFEIRDCLIWHYGQGFPKSLDVSKAIDKAAGADRQKIATGNPIKRMIPGAGQNSSGSWIKDNGREYQPGLELPTTDAAKQWSGWGTALKPATELIVLARKPLIGTVADNVLKHGTGALNIDGCRLETNADVDDPRLAGNGDWSGAKLGYHGSDNEARHPSSKLGRWPANLILSYPEDEYALRRDATPEQKRELYRWLSENH